MTQIVTTLLSLLIVSASPQWETQVQTAVEAHYRQLLRGKVVDYTVEVNRLPRIRSEQVRLLSVSGDEDAYLPRGSRLCWIEVESGGRIKKLGVTVRVETWENCPIVNKTIPARDLLNTGDVEWREMNTTDLRSSRLAARSDLVDCQARVNLPRGTLLTTNKITKIPVIQIGDELSLITRLENLEFSAKGKALQDAYLNEEIRVENIDSRKRLTGVVIDSGKVLVE